MQLLAATDPMAVVSMISTVVLAILTGVYVALTAKQVRAATDPCVIVRVEQEKLAPSLLNIVIENVGNSLARDIRFELSHPIPDYAFGYDPIYTPNQNPQIEEPMKEGPLIDGISALAPGAKRVITWGQYWGLYKALGETRIKVKCYFNRPAGAFDFSNGECEPIECDLDFLSFRRTDSTPNDPVQKVAQQLEKLTDMLRGFADGYRAVKVRVAEMPADSDGQGS